MRPIISFFLACLTLWFMTTGIATAETLTVRSDSWPPYSDDPQSDKPGYMIEVLKEIFAAKGIEVDYQLLAWDYCLKTVENGRFDAVIGTDDEESPSFVFPKESFGSYVNGFYVKKGNPWSYAGINSLKQVRLGVVEGYDYGGDVSKYLESNPGKDKVFTLKNEDPLPNLLKMLKAGRIDAIVENVPVVEFTLKAGNYKKSEIKFAGTDNISITDLYVAFSPAKESSQKYAKIFDEGIRRLRSSGKLQQILNKYGAKDWK